jgi:hypothetical protein
VPRKINWNRLSNCLKNQIKHELVIKSFERISSGNYPTIRYKNGQLTDVLYNASVYRDTDGMP